MQHSCFSHRLAKTQDGKEILPHLHCEKDPSNVNFENQFILFLPDPEDHKSFRWTDTVSYEEL